MKNLVEKAKKFKNIKLFAVAAVVLIISGIGIGIYISRDKDSGPDVEAIREELVAVSKLSVYELNYEGIIPICDKRDVGGVEIPFTESRYFATIDGKMNMGIENFDLIDVVPKVKDGAVTDVKISLPHCVIIDNYTISKSVDVYHKYENILNPIDPDDYREKIIEIENDQLKKVKKENILEKCDERMKEILAAHIRTLYGENVNVDFKFV